MQAAVGAAWDEATRQALEAVLRPTAEARGLPNACYTAPEVFARERELLFAPGWACIGAAGEVPEPGDLKPVELLGLPLLLLRGQDGALRVLHNVCSHRGFRIVETPQKAQTVVRCPYHSWAYDLTGRLRGTPHFGGVGRPNPPGFDKAQHGLKPVRSAVWLDLVFVNLSGDAPAFEEHIAPLTARWQGHDFSRLGYGGAMRLEARANWKLVVENYCESYHLPWVHPGLNSYSRIEDHYHLFGGRLFAGQGSTVYTPAADEPPLPSFPGLTPERAKLAEYPSLFPNVLLGLQADHFYAIRIEPIAPNRTVEVVDFWYLDEAAKGEAFAPTRQRTVERWREVFLEDIFALEGMQAGRSSPAFQGGVFSPALDTPTHHFHAWVAAGLLGRSFDGLEGLGASSAAA